MKLTKRMRQGSSREIHNYEKELWRINWKAVGYPFCGIYVISPDNRWPCKIGISANPVKRLISLQGACWRRLDIAEYCYANSPEEAYAIEQRVHKTLEGDGLLMLGEWFDIRPDKADETIRFTAGVLGIEVSKELPDDPRIKQALGEMKRVGIKERCEKSLPDDWLGMADEDARRDEAFAK